MCNEPLTPAVIQGAATVIAALIAAGLFWAYESRKALLEHNKAFRALFNEFNSRFDKLNNDLNTIRDSANDNPLSPHYQSVVQDYLNLCAEEYLWTKKRYQGIIDRETWEVWKNGIKYYMETPTIEAFFRAELTGKARKSYYGLAEELDY